MKYSICYQTVTEESAKDGDFSDHGYYENGGWRWSLNDDSVVRNIQENPDLYVIPVKIGDLRSVVSMAQELGITFNPDADWGYSVDPDIDYQTGDETQYFFHMSEVTLSTQKRIERLIGIYS